MQNKRLSFKEDAPIKFIENTHQYFNTHSGEECQSVSKILSKIEEPFDRAGISFMMAKAEADKDASIEKIKEIQKNLLDEWDDKKDSSIDHGNWIHDGMEQCGLTGTHKDPMIVSVSNIIDNYLSYGYRSFYEKVLFIDRFNVAGTCDRAIQRQKSACPVVDFYDYKTNLEKGIEFSSMKVKESSIKHYNRYFLEPFSYMEACNYNKYSFQLSIYAYMAEISFNIKVGRLAIIDIHFNKEKTKLVPKILPVNYMRMEVEKLLNFNQSLKKL